MSTVKQPLSIWSSPMRLAQHLCEALLRFLDVRPVLISYILVNVVLSLFLLLLNRKSGTTEIRDQSGPFSLKLQYLPNCHN